MASLGALLDQHPCRVRRRTCLERDVPDGVVPLVNEVGDAEPFPRQLLHVVGERAHARQDLVAAVLGGQAGGHRAAAAAGRPIPLRFEKHRCITVPRTRLDHRRGDQSGRDERCQAPRQSGQHPGGQRT